MDQANFQTAWAAGQPTKSDFLDGYVSEQEYAVCRGVSVRTCQRDRQLQQSPPYVRFGRRIYYRIDAVREWLVKNERAADRPPPVRRGRA